MIVLNNLIGNKLSPSISSNFLDNYNPATGSIYSKIPDSDAADVQAAVDAAELVKDSWRETSIEERSQLLLKIADKIIERLDEFAQAESIDNGKPFWLAKQVDIPRAAANFRFFATAVLHYSNHSHQTNSNTINYTVREPLGIVGCISPWNLPLYLFTWKIAPALASGNCVIAKPSEVTPYTAFLLSEICAEILPAGVLNIVHGLGQKVGAAITRHPMIKAISFTGGTSTGREIARVAAPMFKKLSLELGGKNPNIIFADCDFEKMLKTTVASSFSNQGQICLCGSRIFIEEEIYEKFKNAFVEKVRKLKVSHPNDPDAKLGALVSEPHLQKVESYVNLAQDEGGTVLVGGKRLTLDAPYDKGYYFEPTVIEGLQFDCRTNQEEIFGPVVTITPFRTEDEVLRMANSTEYGLAATIWTENLSKSQRMAMAVKSGIVWINCWMVRDLRTPFGGMKNSGVGREGGFYALDFFTEPKNICIVS